MSVYRP
jgi:integrase